MRSSYPATVSLYKAQALLHSRAWGIFRFARVCVISPKSVELFARGHHVWVGENVTARTPIFCVVLKDGEYWEVEAEWPDGTIEPVYKFKAGLEALNWVKTESAAWVAERVAMGQPIISDTKRRRAPHFPSYRKTPAARGRGKGG